MVEQELVQWLATRMDLDWDKHTCPGALAPMFVSSLTQEWVAWLEPQGWVERHENGKCKEAECQWLSEWHGGPYHIKFTELGISELAPRIVAWKLQHAR